MENCHKFLVKKELKLPRKFDKEIQKDISQIFEFLLTFKNITFYREKDIISKIIHYICDKVELQENAVELTKGVWGLFNLNTNKYYRIYISPRKYDETQFDLVNENIETELLSKLQRKKMKKIKEIIKNKNVDHVIDLSENDIDSVTKELINSFENNEY